MKERLFQVSMRIVLASLLMMAALPALAQVGKEPIDPAPESSSWVAFLMVLLFGVATGVGCLMSSKRSHQD